MISVEQPSATFRPAALLAGTPSARAGHLPFAADLIAALKPNQIVELGVGYGDMYFGLCQIAAENSLACKCYGVDTWRAKSAPAGAMHDAVNRYNEAHYRASSHLLRKSFDEALAQFASDSIGLLSLDGTRSYEVLKRGFDAWLPKVNAGGVILLSDISVRGGESGAWQLWNEIQARFPHFSFSDSQGLGVVGKPQKDGEKNPFLTTLFEAGEEQRERIRRYYSLCAERLNLAARLGASGVADCGSSLFQVFRSQEGEYSNTPDLSQVISPGVWINLQLDLPNGIGDRGLRIDVANRPAVVDIMAITLRKTDATVVWTWNPKDVTDTLRVDGTAVRMQAGEFFRVLSLGQTPHVYLPEFRGSMFEHALSLEIRLRVDLELGAVREMNAKWADFEKEKAEFAAKKASGGDTVNAAALEAGIARAKSEAAKHLAQARIEHENKLKQATTEAETRFENMRNEFEQQSVKQLSQLEEEKRAHQATAMERDNLVAQQPRMLQEISIAQGNVEELKGEVERLSTELGQMEFDLTEMRKLNARMSIALEEERAVRANMQDSSSWQLTKPFRAVGDLFGPRKKY